MLSVRGTHYWLWFILFGVISSAVLLRAREALDPETLWLLVIGCLGVVAGMGNLASRFSRPFDVIVGILFTSVGMLGVLHNLGYILVATNSSSADTANTISATALAGLSLALPYALIHILLGLTSLSHGLRVGAASHSVPAAPHSRAA
jgi:energy-converting hydrogenase Eha subunit C